jgi:ferrous iron transport protein B
MASGGLQELERLRGRTEFLFALAGNPNVGKSTIFNRLTGMGVMTANYPGMTVGINLAVTEFEGRKIGIVDLPGTYALGGISEDQLVARRGVLEGRPDVVIVILDANNLARNLYLLLQFLDLGCPVVAALNLVDQAEAAGIRTDVEALSDILGIPVVPTIGIKGRGLDELMKQALHLAEHREEYPVIPFRYGADIEERVRRLSEMVERELERIPYDLSPRAMALLLLEADREFEELVSSLPGGKGVLRAASGMREELSQARGEEAPLVMARERYGIAGSIAAGVQRRKEEAAIPWGERLWRASTSATTGFPILLAVLAVFFAAVFWGGGRLSELVAEGWSRWVGGPVERALSAALGEGLWSRSLQWAVEGLGAVLEITLPYVIPFYLLLAILEDSGYLNSLAFLSDRFMHRLGLHGRAVIPLLSAAGCNVPAVMGTRVLSTRRERLIASFLIVLIPCSARLAVIMGGVGRYAGLGWALSLLLVETGVVVTSGLLLHRYLPGESTGLVMEMFPFRAPSTRTVLGKTWVRVRDFMYVAAPFILVGSFLLGLLYESGWAGKLEQPLRPLLVYWLGLPAAAGLALVFGFLRKEMALSLLVVFAAMTIPGLGTDAALTEFMTRQQIFTFALVNAVYIPCVATFAVLVRELGWRAALAISAATVTLAMVLGGASRLLFVLVGRS